MTRRPITPRLHLALDVATIVAFAAAPSVLRLEASPRALAYTLATAHTLLTVVVESLAARHARLVARIHAGVELVVGLALLAIPVATAWSAVAQWFFTVAGCAILTVVACTDYTGWRRDVPSY